MLTMVSCSDPIDPIGNIVVDNTGKCFRNKVVTRYTAIRYRLVFNSKNDYIFWGDDIKAGKFPKVFGPMPEMYIGDKVVVKCPIKLGDIYNLSINKLKEYGVYDEVTKYITIVNKR